MKELDQMLARVHNSCEQSSNGPVHHHVRHRLYLRHLTSRLATDRHAVEDEHSQFDTRKYAANEHNNNIQSDGQVGGPSTSTTSEFAVPQHSTSSGSVSNTTAIHLINGHPPGSKQSREERTPRQTSPLLSGCRRKLYLHFNKALGGSKPRWTSPPVDGQSDNRKHGFMRRRKSAHSAAASSDVEERPSSLSGPSEDGILTPPPPLVRSPSAGQIDYSDLAPLKLYRHKGQSETLGDRDEHKMIAYNSSLLLGTGAPLQQPYQIEVAASVNGGICSSGADSVEPDHEHDLVTGPSAILHVAAVEGRSEPDKPPYLVTGNGSASNEDVANTQSDQEAPADHMQQSASDLLAAETNQQEETCRGANRVIGNAAMTPATLENFQRTHNRMCTSFRIKVPVMKSPVDACLLPDDYIAIADYDNGLLILNALGDLIQHRKSPNEVNACGVACTRSTGRLLLLVVRDGVWSINSYNYTFTLLESVRCPTDSQIESWALRRLVVSVDNRLHLLASGESKSCIWTYEMDKREWRTVLVENSGRKTTGNYNDMSVKYNPSEKETRILLCEWKKAQLWSLTVNEKTGAIEQRSIKMKRIKGQEWIVQGPHLAILDDQGDIVVYDGSGKLFLFDGDNFRCKKIVADVGRGEVSALSVSDGWVYTLCRYRLCFDAFLYREQNETNL